jgi:hypothetical protein
MMRKNMRRGLLGALIGFATGLYVASALLDTVFPKNSFATQPDKTALILFYSTIVVAYSLFGIHCMLDSNNSKNKRKIRC